MSDRRYDEDEVAAIFAKAAEEHPRAPALDSSRDHGLTLAELQQIGRDVGIPAENVASAARALDVRRRAGTRRLLGLPIGVERTVTLDRLLTDAEWEQLVVRLREVFGARGTVSGHGTLRQWTNGNLQALLEPTPTGHRLRLTTTKGSARAGIGAGVATLGMSSVMAVATASAGQLGAAAPGIGMMLLAGAGMLAYTVLPLSRWARHRAQQMDAITTGLAEERGALPTHTEDGTG